MSQAGFQSFLIGAVAIGIINKLIKDSKNTDVVINSIRKEMNNSGMNSNLANSNASMNSSISLQSLERAVSEEMARNNGNVNWNNGNWNNRGDINEQAVRNRTDTVYFSNPLEAHANADYYLAQAFRSPMAVSGFTDADNFGSAYSTFQNPVYNTNFVGQTDIANHFAEINATQSGLNNSGNPVSFAMPGITPFEGASGRYRIDNNVYTNGYSQPGMFAQTGVVGIGGLDATYSGLI